MIRRPRGGHRGWDHWVERAGGSIKRRGAKKKGADDGLFREGTDGTETVP